MKKLLLLALVVCGGVLNASAWGDLCLICGENSNWSNTSFPEDFKFTCLSENNYRATVPGSYIKNGSWYFRFRDISSDRWINISPESTEKDQEITGSVYSTNWQNSSAKAFYITKNPDAEYVHIYAHWDTSIGKWSLTSEVITSTTTYKIAFTNPSNWVDENVKVYAYLDGVKLNGNWPGITMTKEPGIVDGGFVKQGSLYTASITGATGAKIIFSNSGDNQSWTFDLVDDGVYNNTECVENVQTTISSLGYSTFSSAYPLDFTNIVNVTAYRAEQTATNMVLLKKVSGKVPSAVGLILKGEADANVEIPTSVTSTSIGDNLLVASVDETTVTPGGTDYYYFLAGSSLSDIGFYQLTSSSTSGAGKAYLATTVALASEGNGARAAWIFDDETQGISSVEGVQPADVVYDLQGRVARVVKAGLYIKNGKKVVLK